MSGWWHLEEPVAGDLLRLARERGWRVAVLPLRDPLGRARGHRQAFALDRNDGMRRLTGVATERMAVGAARHWLAHLAERARREQR